MISGREPALQINAREEFLRSKVRLTPQRQEVYQILLSTRDHPTAAEIFMRAKDGMPTISLATVYNCLEAMVSGGMVKQVNVERSATRYCPNLTEHAHFICNSCGSVHDIPLSDSKALERCFDTPDGFSVETHEVILRGLCNNCTSYVTKN